MRPSRVLMTIGAGLLAACAAAPSSTPGPAPAAAVAAVDLGGMWDFSVDLGDRVSTGIISLARSAEGYSGTITPEGTNTMPVRSLTLTGDSVAMLVETPEGPVTFDGSLGADRVSMRGTVHYHGGQNLPLNARKRP
jgi:hypothetical protein